MIDKSKRLTIFEGPNRIVRRDEASRLTAIPEGTLRNLVNDPSGPPVVRIGPRSIGYELAALEEWIRRMNEAA